MLYENRSCSALRWGHGGHLAEDRCGWSFSATGLQVARPPCLDSHSTTFKLTNYCCPRFSVNNLFRQLLLRVEITGYDQKTRSRGISVKMDLMVTETFDRDGNTPDTIDTPAESQPQGENDNKFQRAIAVWRGRHKSGQWDSFSY